MSSDSDSEDDKVKQFLEAADTTLLNNTLFQKPDENRITTSTKNESMTLKINLPKSLRYISDDNEKSWTDCNFPKAIQKHLTKKLSNILEENYEFYNITTDKCSKPKTMYKSRVKLVKDANCYVNSYEDYEYDTQGPKKKPVIKRRIIDNPTDHKTRKADVYKLIAVDGNYILSGQELKTWAKKKERKDKIFYYKMANNGVLHARAELSEFTENILKNK